MEKDRNFDDLAERFERRVYGGLKGEIRLAVLWRDLLAALEPMEKKAGQPVGGRGLVVLDAGGGLGQLSARLAARGHQLHFNDLSKAMLAKAQRRAAQAGVEDSICWHRGAWQELDLPDAHFDLVLCHALLEWLAEPGRIIAQCRKWLRNEGLLSLCYYNPAGKTYRNLVRGNFDMLRSQQDYVSDRGSLTPNNACSREQVLAWLDQHGFAVIEETGIRVFHDYVVDRRGGHADPDAVLAMELQYSTQQPFKWLGRYQHILARPV